MIYGLIIAAGKQTRFDSKKPKALVEYKGKPLLDHNIDNLSRFCNVVYVVCSRENSIWFNNYNKIVIDSGLGCGDAVWKALNCLKPFGLTDYAFIQWGDCFVDPDVYRCCIEESKSATDAVIIPCQWEVNPYVCFEQSSNLVNVKFSKYEETPNEGFHDLSLFYAPAFKLHDSLSQFQSEYYEDGFYNFPNHGNEFQFLDIFNCTLTSAKIVDLTDKHLHNFSFNTLDEYRLQVDK